MSSRALSICFIAADISASLLEAADWERCPPAILDKYWSGEEAPASRHSRARALWSPAAIYFRFDAAQDEPLVVSQSRITDAKTIGLWERDVCEVFIAPERNAPQRYFEFEAAPTGEWLDVAIDLTTGERQSDWTYESGMRVASRARRGEVSIAIEIPWTAFGKTPVEGDAWLGNLFRCVGSGSERGYLAWRPTGTPEPAFHVPAAFGEFRFLK
jgi:alpha-galactosidase